MADISTAVSMARVPILGEDGRISDDYIPAAIGENTAKAEAAATRAETAATNAEGSASAARQSATGAQGSASAASASATQAQQSATTAGGAATSAQSAQTAAEAAKAAAETAQSAAAGSAHDAKQSATAAQQSAASVADKFISSAQATTLDPGSQATASVENQVLTIGVPKGEKGDKGDQGEKGDPGTGVPDGGTSGQLLSKTDSGTAWVDPPSGNVLKGTLGPAPLLSADDAYPQKPIEVRIKGKTWVNRWPVINRTSDGITVATDGTGLVTVTGTATADADVTADVSGWATGKSYTTMINATPTGCSAYFEVQKPSGNTSINATTTGATLNVASDATNCVAGVHVTSGTTVNASFRVMLVDGTEAPDCFTPPASITSAQPEKLVTAGKNLCTIDLDGEQYTGDYGATTKRKIEPGVVAFGLTLTNYFSPDNVRNWSFEDGTLAFESRLSGYGIGFGVPCFPGQSVAINVGSMNNAQPGIAFYDVDGVFISQMYFVSGKGTIVTPSAARYTVVVVRSTLSGNDWVSCQASNIQLELGSTATSYEPPNVTTTPLPKVELRSLPNGTCDELVIKADGTCEVERKTGYIASYTDEEVTGEYVSTGNGLEAGASIVYELDEPTAELQSHVALPALPAPTFNQYHDSPVPSDTSVEYERDINIAFSELQAQISATTVREATNG